MKRGSIACKHIKTFAPEGAHRPAARDLVLETWVEREPRAVTVQTGNESAKSPPLPHLDAGALAKSPAGWTYVEGVLSVKTNDRFEPARFVLQL
jgi:hypothetical protein